MEIYSYVKKFLYYKGDFNIAIFCIVCCFYSSLTVYGQETVTQIKDSFGVKVNGDTKYMDDFDHELSEKQFNDSLASGIYCVTVSDAVIKLKRKHPNFSALVGSVLPSLTYSDMDGKKHKIGDMTSPVLIVIWDKTCVPCYKELIELNNLIPKYPDIQIYAFTADSKENVESFLSKKDLELDNLIIIPEYQKEYEKLLKTTIVPANILIDDTQRIQYISIGNNIEALEKAINKL